MIKSQKKRLNGFAERTDFVHPACLPYGRYTNEYTDYEADANLVAEADYCWFVGWGFTGAKPSNQQVKPNDLARVLQQSRHYLMKHDTCNDILDKWNIDKKEHLCAVGYEKSPYIGHACEVPLQNYIFYLLRNNRYVILFVISLL